MFETCVGLSPSNAKHGKATTLNRALKVLKALGLLPNDFKAWSSLVVTSYPTVKSAFAKSCLDKISLKAVSDAILEGFIKKAPKLSASVDKAKSSPSLSVALSPRS